jgi:diguanylate cyclase (GGDEF)-like protein/PAS domain S-box-containing protein
MYQARALHMNQTPLHRLHLPLLAGACLILAVVWAVVGGALVSTVPLMLLLMTFARLRRDEQAQREALRTQRSDQLVALEHNVARSLAEAETARSALRTIMQSVCESQGWQCGRYFAVDEQAGALRFVEGWSVPDPRIQPFIERSRALVLKPGEGLVGKVWQSGEPLWVADITHDPRALRKAFTMEAGVRGTFCFAVTSEGKTIGVLAFNSREVREPDERLLLATRVIGSQIGQFVQRKQAEQVMRASEERFRSLAQLSLDVYWEQDEEYRFTSFTDSDTEWKHLGRPSRLVGKKRWEQNYLNMTPDDWAAHIALLDARRSFRDLELCRLNDAGEKVWLNVSGEPVFGESGKFKGYRGVGRDITARKRAEQVLRLEHAVTRCLAGADSELKGVEASVRAVCDTEGWECGRYFRVDESAGLLRFAGGWGIADPDIERYIERSRDITYAPGAGITGRVWQTGEPLWVSDRGAHHGVAHSVFGKARDVFIFPLLAGGKTLGVLTFISRTLRAPDERLLQAVRVIGSQIGQFVQRKQAQEVLRESEARFRSLTGLSSDTYWEQDDQYRFTSVIGTGSVHSNQRNLQRIGKRRWDLDYINMSAADWAAHIAVLDARRAFRELELCWIGESGERAWVSVSGAPVFDSSGAFKGYRGIGKDITARKRGEELLRLEHTVVRCLAGGEGTVPAMREVIKEICQTHGWACGRYLSVDEKAGVLRFSAGWSIGNPDIERFIEESKRVTYAPGTGLAGEVWQSGKSRWIADIDKDPRMLRKTVAREFGLHGAVFFPVASEGKTIGVLAFNSRQVREPDERLLSSAQVIGSQIAQFLRRKESEEELRRFRAAMDASADMVWLVDPAAMRIVDANDTACRTLGYTREEVLAMGPQDIICASSEELAEIYRRLVAGDMSEMTVAGFYRRKNGSLLPMESMRRVVRSGEGHVIVVAARDITERLLREEELRRFRLAMDNCADIIVLIDRATMRFVDVNSTACRLLGYTREELLQMGPQDVLPVSRAQLEQSYDELIANPARASGMNTFYRCKDGTDLPFESTRRVLRSGDTYIIAAISRDIRERLAAEEALRRSNERFNLAVQATNDVIWDWDLSTDERWWNENLTRVFGYAPQEIGRTGAFWKARIHPDDRDRVVGLVEGLLRSGGDNWSGEYRFLRADGTCAHVLDRGHAVREPGGKAVRMIGAMTDITMRKEAEEKLAYLAQFDSLTGLPNRHLFRDRLMQAMARAKRTGTAMAVLFIDLDRFKLINDTLGHSAGDRLLKEATRRLQSCVRSSDTVGRFGGDEFGAIIADLAKPAHASLVAQKIIDVLAQPFHLDGHESYVTASIGITLFPADGEEAGTLIMNADTAMYRAKEQGRNTYQYFTREMNERAMQRVKMETALRRAIERREFLLHYQPKVKIGSGEICGFEALLRWQNPEHGLVPPLEFVPVLEDTGLIVPVGEWVIGQVCAQIRHWQASGLRVPPVAVNLSARQFQLKGLEETVSRALRESGIDPALLHFELTESLLMKEPEVAARTLRGLKELGVMLSVDDFGTGYSSLSYLKRFPIDALKIDRAFIHDVTIDPDDAAITFAIIGLAHSLKLKVIAEGVETEDQLRFLRMHGCDEMQGFLFSRPVGADECAGMLARARNPGPVRRSVARLSHRDGRPVRVRGGGG